MVAEVDKIVWVLGSEAGLGALIGYTHGFAGASVGWLCIVDRLRSATLWCEGQRWPGRLFIADRLRSATLHLSQAHDFERKNACSAQKKLICSGAFSVSTRVFP